MFLLSDGTGTDIVGCASSASVLQKSAYGSVGPMVYPPEGSVPNFLGFLDPWDLVYHHADGHHGAFAIPVSVSGASQIISYEANKPASRLTVWGVVESRHDIANVPSPPLPQGIVGDPSHKFCSIVAV